ncbi:hypothetical protein QJS10_CPA03g00882 [Acorus calamus]|uniref:1-phosphatidylinositol 4-kinase n=1 Tax=Acorus calamus TaxID=4465 RepID=A0AAV9F9E1_ACOCL|nr:hypothetical protein QJS10_CPA03g00882 [Acorus calamus]
MLDAMGRKYIAVFKPIDEEPMAENNPRGLPVSLDGEGLKRGTRVGEGALREVAAYLLDHPKSGRRTFLNGDVGFSGVPPTVMVRCSQSGFDLRRIIRSDHCRCLWRMKGAVKIWGHGLSGG